MGKRKANGRKIDPDNPPLSAERLKRFRPSREVVPHIVAAYERSLGRPRAGDHPKVAVSLRLDPEIISAFKAMGPGWQTRINDVLVKAAAKLKAASSRSATR